MRKRTWSKAVLYLAPSRIEGVGCFADMRIRKGEYVRTWLPEDTRFVTLAKAQASPHRKLFKRFGIRTGNGYWAPANFLRISVGWYMNHSEDPNLQSDDGDVTYYALRDIRAGEEVTMDYRRMDEHHDNLSRDVLLPGRRPAAPKTRSRKTAGSRKKQ